MQLKYNNINGWCFFYSGKKDQNETKTMDEFWFLLHVDDIKDITFVKGLSLVL